MAKNIVFCADGTWDGPDAVDHANETTDASNVFKLFLDLDGEDTPESSQLEKERERILKGEGAPRQIAKYIDGVGDSRNFLTRLLGGLAGLGLVTRIVRGYTFVSRNYVPGDRIYLVGFSRGAYTARALGEMISAIGLMDARKLDLSDRPNAYRLGTAIWYQYLHEAQSRNRSALGRLEEAVMDFPDAFSQPPAPDTRIHAPIEAICVWDTVGALGIPDFKGQSVAVDVFKFAHRALGANVKFGRQAIAVDEERADFTPSIWEADARIEQVLFPGSHADVGGGYPTTDNESGLSDGALQWMMGEAAGLGMKFSPSLEIEPRPDACGVAHQPIDHKPWASLRRGRRTFPPHLWLSKSILDRMSANAVIPDPGLPPVPYRPGNLSDYVEGVEAKAGTKVV